MIGIHLIFWPGGWEGGGLPYRSDRDARGKIQIKPLMGTNVDVAQA